ncbi:hypothetical protein ETB97_009787 [Aspergillus alliaceus]|uniref:Thioester reductase (TE) domain-containing protein n=1 Tax=Petromyces alliaceus TaxID=209559 RepID=A0A8H6A672_PETAA|nr:hypothetical protein ETB97_009787 [Aspergillus burnettii]
MLNISKIVALPSQLGLEDLGLSPSVLGELRRSFTEMIHVAWAVNFTLGERSFEAQHIRGIHKLINHCLSSERPSPAAFYFCSSISVAAATRLPATIAEAPIPELSWAQNMGYARSKLVVERIVYVAAKQTSMTARIPRVGQNMASILKSLPAVDETIIASSGYRGERRSTIEGDQPQREHKKVVQRFRCFFHVQNAKTFRLAEDLLPALRRSGLEFDVLPKRQWDPRKNPAIELLDFSTDKYDNDNPGRVWLSFEMKTQAASPALSGGVELIESGLVEKFIDVLRRNEWQS